MSWIKSIVSVECSSDHFLGKIIASYHHILTNLKDEVTNSQKKYEISLKFLTFSIILACLHFIVFHGGYDLITFLWEKIYV